MIRETFRTNHYGKVKDKPGRFKFMMVKNILIYIILMLMKYDYLDK